MPDTDAAAVPEFDPDSTSPPRVQEIIRLALASDDLKTARAQLKRLQALAPDDLRTIELEGDVALIADNPERARAAYDRLLARTDSPEAQGLGAYSLGLMAMAEGDHPLACERFRDAIAHYERADLPFRLKAVLGAYGQATSELGEFPAAVAAFQRALAMGPHPDPNDSDGAWADADSDAESCRLLADTYRQMGQLAEAEATFRDAIARHEALDDLPGKAHCLDGLGVVMQIAGRYEDAEALHRESLAICEVLDDLEGLSAAYGNLTLLGIHRKDWDGAEAWAREAMRVDQELANDDGLATGQLHLAMIEIERGNLVAAESLLDQARAHYEAHGTPLDHLFVISNSGELHRRQGQLDLADRELTEALRLAEETGYAAGVAKVNDQLALLRKDQGRLDDARALWTLALSQYRALGSPGIIQEIEAHLADLG